jgi:prepilin peptidase CpaA
MGGGDAKLFGAVALLVPPNLAPALIVGIALSGGVLAVVFLTARRRIAVPSSVRPLGLLARAVRVERWRLRRGGPLPYAVAIASGAIIVILQ